MTPEDVEIIREGIECNEVMCGCEEDARAALDDLVNRTMRYEAALKAIATTNDDGVWIEIYREAGGGYEGLQAIAEAALS